MNYSLMHDADEMQINTYQYLQLHKKKLLFRINQWNPYIESKVATSMKTSPIWLYRHDGMGQL